MNIEVRTEIKEFTIDVDNNWKTQVDQFIKNQYLSGEVLNISTSIERSKFSEVSRLIVIVVLKKYRN